MPAAAGLLELSRRTNAVGRLRVVRPQRFRVLCLVCHWPWRARLNVVNRTRLLAAARLVLLLRQHRGLKLLLSNAMMLKRACSSNRALCMVAIYSHEWDETSSSFRFFGKRKEILNKMGVGIQAMQQRGALSVMIDSPQEKQRSVWSEQWSDHCRHEGCRHGTCSVPRHAGRAWCVAPCCGKRCSFFGRLRGLHACTRVRLRQRQHVLVEGARRAG